MSIVNYFKDKLLGKFFGKTELPPEDETFDVPVITDEDVNDWLWEEAEVYSYDDTPEIEEIITPVTIGELIRQEMGEKG